MSAFVVRGFVEVVKIGEFCASGIGVFFLEFVVDPLLTEKKKTYKSANATKDNNGG